MISSYASRIGLLIALGGLVLGSAAARADDDVSGQTIYLDPKTGDVIDGPAAADADTPGRAQTRRQSDAGSASERSSPYKTWQTEDGTQMLSVDPAHNNAERVVRCADGSLHMGESDADATTGESALCRH